MGGCDDTIYTGFVGFIACFLSCTGGSGGGDDDDDGGGTPTTSTLNGKVVSPDATAISGVSVEINGGTTTTTDAEGEFSMTATVGEDRVVMFSKTGYMGTSKLVDVFADVVSSVLVKMVAESTPVVLDADTGGTATGEANAFITAPPNAFVDGQGNPVTGNVDVHMTVLDPSDPLDASAYPGTLLGRTLSGEIVPLRTFGVVDITARKNGETLQIKSGENVTIGIPARSVGNTPDTSDMWYFDATEGMWIEIQNDGTYDGITHTYQTQVSHLTPYNSDNPYTPTCINGMVQDAEGNPVIAYIRAIPQGEDVQGNISEDFTEPDGYFCMYVEKDTTVLLKVYVAKAVGDYDVDFSEPTLRTIETGGAVPISQYPTDCSRHCTRVLPTITLGEEDPGPVPAEAACVYSEIGYNFSEDPFWGTCARSLGELYECYAPAGVCFYEMDILGWMFTGTFFEMEFENGSKMVSEMDIVSGELAMKLYGPDPFNKLCGTMSMDENGDNIFSIDGEDITIRTTESGAVEIECDFGSTFTLTGEQLDAIGGCSGAMDTDDNGVECKAKPGTYTAGCTFDSDCEDGLRCCGPIGGDKKCLMDVECDLYCDQDADCMGLDICCAAGMIRMCVDFNACQALQGDEVSH